MNMGCSGKTESGEVYCMHKALDQTEIRND